MKYSKTVATFLLALLISSLPAQAWDGYGHMAIAYLAYQSLTAATKSRVDQLVALNPYYSGKWSGLIPSSTSAANRKAYMFMLAATWPDEIKNDSAYKSDSQTGVDAGQNIGYDGMNQHRYWRFIDTPLVEAGAATIPIPAPNAKTQVAAFRTVLASDAADPLKSYDLVWLIHLVGDLHQPLHCSTRVSTAEPKGDAGGNDVVFCSVGESPCNWNLHSFWDDILGTSTSLSSAKTFAAKLTKAKSSAADVADSQKWIDASFALAQSSVYQAPVALGEGPYQATKAYTTKAGTVARKQWAVAAARLAEILNSELK